MSSRMVLLEHSLPDGSKHYDWMIHPPAIQGFAARNDGGEPIRGLHNAPEPDDNDRVLLTFRILERIDRPDCDSFVADQLEPHRYAYLKYQGPVSGNRGTVRRLAGGIVRKVEHLPGGISIRARFTNGEERIWAGLQDGDIWSFRRSRPVVIKGPKVDREVSDDDTGPSGYYYGGGVGMIDF